MNANINLDAFERIVIDHFRVAVRHHSPMNRGSYARVFLFTLENNFQVVGRVVLPVREAVKTEAEVAAMEMVRSRTDIPVPQVYIYCSSANNPVGAEWILMEYLRGELLGDCFGRLTNQQKLRTSVDLAMVMSSLFIITASYIGSLLPELRKDDSNTGHYPLRYPLDSHPLCEATTFTQDVRFRIGPMNDVTLLDYPNQVPASLCGPFDSEFDFLEAFAFRGRPPTRPNNKLDRWAFNKVFEVYHTIRPLYRGFIGSSSDLPDETFHFSHGDLSSWNILVDPQSGTITGVIDWEMAGFRPAWLAAVAGGWFNDDQDRFLMTDDQSRHLEYGDDKLGDAELRSHFRLQLAGRNMELFCHYWLGPELRAIFYACCHAYPGNAEIWLEKYEKHEWDLELRGPFPFDLMGWILEKLDLEETLRTGTAGEIPE